MLRALLAATWLWIAVMPGTSWAQGMTFSIDPVLVALPETPDDPAVRPGAASLHADLERMLGVEYLVIPFATVPDYSDYSAAVYLDSCPAGKYIECAFVLGSRSKASWVVGIQIARDRYGEDEALFTVVDVAEARPVVSFSSRVTRDNHGAVAAGLSLVLDSVIQGAAAQSDVRGDPMSEREAWERRRDEAQRAAEDLAFADQELEILVRQDVGEFEEPRLTPGDLSEYEQRDDQAPWVALGMTKGEYVRYKNSGESVDDFADEASGRLHRVLVRVEGGFGAGSYLHHYDGRWVLDDTTLEPVEVSASLQMEKAPTTVFRAEIAYGVHEWFEVGFSIGARMTRFQYFYQREIEGEEVPDKIAEGATYRYSPEYRVFTQFVPLPTLPVRPTLMVGVAYWKGAPISAVLVVPGPTPDSAAAQFVSLHAAPGVEVSPNRWVSLFARFTTEFLLFGDRTWESKTGEPVMIDPYVPKDLKMGGGYLMSFGVTGHFGPLFKTK